MIALTLKLKFYKLKLIFIVTYNGFAQGVEVIMHVYLKAGFPMLFCEYTFWCSLHVVSNQSARVGKTAAVCTPRRWVDRGWFGVFSNTFKKVIFGRLPINFNVKYKELKRIRKKFEMTTLSSKMRFCSSKREFSVTSRHFVQSRAEINFLKC